MNDCLTLRVKHDDGFKIINAVDFIGSEHEPFDESDAKVVEATRDLRAAFVAAESKRLTEAHMSGAKGLGGGVGYVAFGGDPNFGAPGFVPTADRPHPYDGRG